MFRCYIQWLHVVTPLPTITPLRNHRCHQKPKKTGACHMEIQMGSSTTSEKIRMDGKSSCALQIYASNASTLYI